MSTKTEICNMTISHLGIGKEISNVDSEKSQEASACRRFFDTARDATLRDHQWSFAKKYLALGKVEDTPNTEYLFSYRYPSDCVKALKILSGIRQDTRQSRVHYIIASDSQGKLIFTDAQDAVLKYTFRNEAIDQWPEDYNVAFSFRLAAYTAPRLTAGDPFKLKREMLAQYRLELSIAMSSDLNEQQDEEVPNSEFHRARTTS